MFRNFEKIIRALAATPENHGQNQLAIVAVSAFLVILAIVSLLAR